MKPTYFLAWAALFTAAFYGQTPTTVDLRTQSRDVDFRAAGSTKPFKTGTALPGNCTPAEAFFKTDAAAEANLFGCIAPNVWAVLGSGGAAGTTVPFLILAPIEPKPACDAAHRGMLWFNISGPGAADTAEVCQKDALESYGWVAAEPANPAIQTHISATGAVHGAVPQAVSNAIVVRDGSGDAALHKLSANTIEVGDGTMAGEMALYELAVNGNEHRSWLAPDSLTATVRFRLPDAIPAAGQVMRFGTPVSNISDVAFQDANAHTHSAVQIQTSDKAGTDAKLVTASAPGISGNCAQWTATGLGDAGAPCGTGGPALKVTQTIQLYTVANAAGTASLAGGWFTPNAGGATKSSLGSGLPGALQFDDTAQYATAFFSLPANWDTTPVSLTLVWAPASTGGTDVTVRWQYDFKCVSPGAVISPSSFLQGNNTDVTVASANNQYYMRTTLTPSLAGCAPGSLAYTRIWRDGANDTFTGSVFLQALEVALKLNLN